MRGSKLRLPHEPPAKNRLPLSFQIPSLTNTHLLSSSSSSSKSTPTSEQIWRDLYPSSKGITKKKIYEAVRTSRSRTSFEKALERLSNLSVSDPQSVTSFKAPGIGCTRMTVSGEIIENNCSFTLMTGLSPEVLRNQQLSCLQVKKNPSLPSNATTFSAIVKNRVTNKRMKDAMSKNHAIITVSFNATKSKADDCWCMLSDLRPFMSERQCIGYYGLHVAVDVSHIPSNFLLGNGNVNSNGDDCDQNTSLACITYMGSDLAFVQTLRHISKNWANVVVTHTNDNVFRSTVVILEENGHVEICTRLRRHGVVCPLIVLTTSSKRSHCQTTVPVARERLDVHATSKDASCYEKRMVSTDDETVVWSTYAKKDMDKFIVRKMLREAGQLIPNLTLPILNSTPPLGFFDKGIKKLKEIEQLHRHFSKVTEFINKETDEIYVLKEMFETVHRTQKYNILTRLDHIDLVKFIGTYSNSNKKDQRLHSVWEPCKFNLAQHIETKGVGIPLSYLKPIVCALSYLHSHGIVHRNLAAEHIMGDSLLNLKLGGLRVVKHIGLSRTRTHCGVSDYISPELMLNRSYGLATDSWSLGVLFYLCSTAELPFNAEHPLDFYAEMCEIQASIPSVPTMQECLTVNPQKRIEVIDIRENDSLYDLDGSRNKRSNSRERERERGREREKSASPNYDKINENLDRRYPIQPGQDNSPDTSPCNSPNPLRESSTDYPSSRSRKGSEDEDEALKWRDQVSISAPAPHYLIAIALSGSLAERKSQWENLQKDATRELVEAINTSNISLTKYLLNQLANPNSNIKLGEKIRIEKLPPLLNINGFDDKNVTACHYAAAKGNLKILELLVDEWKADILCHRYHYTVWCHALNSVSKGLGCDDKVLNWLKARGAENLQMVDGNNSSFAKKYTQQYQGQFQSGNSNNKSTSKVNGSKKKSKKKQSFRKNLSKNGFSPWSSEKQEKAG